MGKPHPIALRSRVVAFVEEGHGRREAARHLRVSPRFVNNLIKLKAETGSLEPRRQGRIGGGKLEPHAGFVRDRLEAAGDLTLDALCVERAGRGVMIHRSSVGRLLRRLGLSHKKACPRAGGERCWLANGSGLTSARPVSFGSSGARPFSTRL